ncbi:hypothetical protein OIU76_017039 [Salix suchowensis]|nr:hypothetical protein OIU76_017039 [Salix suchowensis]
MNADKSKRIFCHNGDVTNTTSLFPKRPNEISVSINSTALAKSAIESWKHGPANTKGSFFKSTSKNHEPPFSSVGAPPVAPALPGKVSHSNVATCKSHPSENFHLSPAVSISLSSFLIGNNDQCISKHPIISISTDRSCQAQSHQSSTASTSLSPVSFSPVSPSSSSTGGFAISSSTGGFASAGGFAGAALHL